MNTSILHISDTHLGNRQYGSDIRREDFADALEEAVEIAIEEDVDAVIHTGDLFDSRDPSLPDLNRCIDILNKLDEAGIPFYGIVGNHERKMDDQFLDLIGRVGVAERLDKSPTVVNDHVALYGIDAVTNPAWHAEDFTLEEPPEDAFTLLCMHQLLHPPVPEIMSEHPLEDVLDRVNINLDALALGDYHEAEGVEAQGTKVWYPGSTERCAVDEDDPRTVSLLEIEDDTLTRTKKEIDARPFLSISLNFAEDDGHGFAESVIDRYDVEDKVVMVTIRGESSTVTSKDVREIVMNRNAAVCQVDDQRGGPDVDLSGGPTGEIQSAERLIEEKLAEENLSEIAVEVEEQVRTENPATSGFHEEVEELVLEAQEEVFADQPDTSAATEAEE